MRHNGTVPRISGITVLPGTIAVIGILLSSPTRSAGGRGPGQPFNKSAYTASVASRPVAKLPCKTPIAARFHRPITPNCCLHGVAHLVAQPAHKNSCNAQW